MINNISIIICFYLIASMSFSQKTPYLMLEKDNEVLIEDYENSSLGRIGDYPFPTNPEIDRAKGYVLKGKAKSALMNYGNFINWDQYPSGGWGKYSYLPNLSFIAGITGQAYSSDFTWTKKMDTDTGLEVWNSSEAFDAWFEGVDSLVVSEGHFKTVVYDVKDDRGQIAAFRDSKIGFIKSGGVQWSIDYQLEEINIYFDDYLLDEENGPNYANQRVGFAYPWAIRPKLKERLDTFDLFEYGDDNEEWTEDDVYEYYGATFQESYFTWNDMKSDWQPVTDSRKETHGLDVSSGDIFGGVELVKGSSVTDPSDPFPLLAHSEYAQTWPTLYNWETGENVPYWPGWWADKYWGDSPLLWAEKGIVDCDGTRQDDDCWKPEKGDFVSDMDVFMQFDDRWAFNGNQVENGNTYLQTGYPLGLRVMSTAHSYGIAYAEDIMFFTVKVRNESGAQGSDEWCAFERNEYGQEVKVYDDNGNQICGPPMIMADGTVLNAGKGFNYEKLYLGFYMDADVLAGEISRYTGVHSHNDDFMEYIDCEIPSKYYPSGTCKYVNGEKLRVSMATIYDYDGESGQPDGENIGMVAVQLLDSPKATKRVDLDEDGQYDIDIGEPLKMTDWHWFDWYNRPGVVSGESDANVSAGSATGKQAPNKEEINYKIMAGDTTNLSAGEKRRYFHTPDPATDLDILVTPHFDSLEGLEETEFFTREPDGLDCVLEMSTGPFDLNVGEEVSFSFCLIFGENHTDLIRNAEFAQIMYNAHYQGYSPPSPPIITTVTDHQKVTIYWTNNAEVSKDVVTTYSDFEGYKIYKSRDGGQTWGSDADKISDDKGVHVGWKPYAQFDLSAVEDSAFCIKGFDDINSNGIKDESEECIIAPDCSPCQRNKNYSGPDRLARWFSLGEDTGFDAIRLDSPIKFPYEGTEDPSDSIEYHYAFIDTNVYDGLEYTYSVVAYDMGVPPADTILNNNGSLEIDSIEDPENWGNLNPYPSLENPKGTTIHDANFDIAVPGFAPSLNNKMNVIVVPNPYIAYSGMNESEYLRQIRFTKLPPKCKIKIYTITGEFVFEIDHDNNAADTKSYDGNEFWDMRTINNQEVSPGLYLFVVISEGRESFTGKFAIVR